MSNKATEVKVIEENPQPKLSHQDRIKAIQDEIDAVVNEANRHVSFLNGQISVLKELIDGQ